MSELIRFFFTLPENVFVGFLWGAFWGGFLVGMPTILGAYIVGHPEWGEPRYVTLYRFIKRSFSVFFAAIYRFFFKSTPEFIKDTYELRKTYKELTRHQRERQRQANIARFKGVYGFFKKVIGTTFSLLWKLSMGIEDLFRAFLSLLWWLTKALFSPLRLLLDATIFKQQIADQQLYDDVVKKFAYTLPDIGTFAAGIFPGKDPLPSPAIVDVMWNVAKELYTTEFAPIDVPAMPDPSNEAEMEKWRATLTNLLTNVVPRDPLVAIRMIGGCFKYILDAVPEDSDVGLTVPLKDAVPDFTDLVESVMWSLYPRRDDMQEQVLFVDLRKKLDDNRPRDKKGMTIYPSEYKDGHDVAVVYLRGTPLSALLSIRVPVPITERLRFEHFHLLSSSGGGKTTAMQHFLMHDFEKVAQGRASVIVIDSQSILINKISHLAALKDRLVIVDPKDVAHPVALSLFSLPKGGTTADRDRAETSLIQLLSEVFMPEMTPKQSILLEAVLRLMLRIPNATIETLYYFLQPDGYNKYQQYITALPSMSQAFFHNEYRNDKQFRETREQLVWRLFKVLNNTTFLNMFAHPESKLNLFDEMQAGKVILINTDKDTLSDQGTELLGRFFIALIAQAAQQRVNLKEDDMMPCFVYIDEFAEYATTASRFLKNVFSQARKFKVGMFVAHHSLSDLPAETQNAIETNTSIKFVRAPNHDDAVHMAKEMRTTPEFIVEQGIGRFAVFLRDGKMKTALSVAMPIGAMEAAPKLSHEDYEAMRQRNRERYTVPATPQPLLQEAVEAAITPTSVPQSEPRPKPVDQAPKRTRKKETDDKIDTDHTNIQPTDW